MMKTRTLTIMFADIQGYTRRSAQQTREETQLFVTEIKQLIQTCVEKRNGNLIKSMGDGFLITFESPTDAVMCGIEIQKAIEKRNAFIADSSKIVSLRVGINTGEVNIDTDGDIYGSAVNITAKIQQSALPNKVFISEATYLAMNESEIKALNLESVKSKGILKKVKLYKILKEFEPGGLPSARDTRLEKRSISSYNLKLILSAVIVILLAVLGLGRLEKTFPVRQTANKDYVSSCKIEGILHSAKNPSVMIGRNTYFSGNRVCGATIKKIYQDRIIAESEGKEKTYRIGETIK